MTNENAVHEIAIQRNKVEKLQKEFEQIGAEIDNTPLGQSFISKDEEIVAAKSQLEEVEGLYREYAVRKYEETQEKKFKGGEVKIRKTYSYEDENARAWINEHKHFKLLTIDKKPFLDVAKSLKLDLLTTEEKPTFYMKKDLSEFEEIA